MSEITAQRLIHPAHAQLVQAARAERRALVRALAIEADWRFHDGPEWAARYWAAFSDLRRDVDSAPELRLGAALAPRSSWSPLAPVESDQARAIFRALLAALHPQVAPRAAADPLASHVERPSGRTPLKAKATPIQTMLQITDSFIVSAWPVLFKTNKSSQIMTATRIVNPIQSSVVTEITLTSSDTGLLVARD